jgi:hypothetical protein
MGGEPNSARTGGDELTTEKRPELVLERPYRIWGYPVVPGIFVLLAVVLLANTFLQQRSDSLWGLGLVGSGIPVYFLWRLWQKRKSED